MPDLDPELLERTVRWCAEAGRHASPDDVRRALAGLGWDELLAVRAILADPPPARPLGPQALADLARGAPADVAAEREREGRYRPEEEGAGDDAAGQAAPAPRGPPRRARRRGPGVLIRRARERAAPPAPAPAPLPALAELQRPGGRAVLERLVRRHGARRAPLLAALAAGWSGPGAAPPGDDALDALLDHHGLARAFERRERDELLHALRAAGGVRSAAAARLGLDPAALDAALDRLGARPQAERIREERRAELRRRATLAERVRLLLAEEPRLRDLDLVEEVERDLRARLPEHARALRAAGAPLAVALARSLSVSRDHAEVLVRRFGLVEVSGAAPRPSRPPAGRRRAGRPRGDARSEERPARPRPSSGTSGRGPRGGGERGPGGGGGRGPRVGGERGPRDGGGRGPGGGGGSGPRGGGGRGPRGGGGRGPRDGGGRGPGGGGERGAARPRGGGRAR